MIQANMTLVYTLIVTISIEPKSAFPKALTNTTKMPQKIAAKITKIGANL
jgi:hypothetical protein